MKKLLEKHSIARIITTLAITACIFTLTIGAVGTLITYKINSSVETVYNNFGWSNNLNTIQNNLTKMKLHRQTALYEGNDGPLYNIRVNNNEITTNYNVYTSTECDEKEWSFLNPMWKAYGEYYKLTDSIVSNLKNGVKPTDDELLKLSTLENTININLEGLKNYLIEWSKEDMDKSDSLYTYSLITYISLILLCIILFTLLSYFIIKNIKKEMLYISSILTKVSNGDLRVSIDHSATNEFGVMKKDIKNTIDKISSILIGVKNKSRKIDERAEDLTQISEEVNAVASNVSQAIDQLTKGSEDQANDLTKITEILDLFSNTIESYIDGVKILDHNSKGIAKKAMDSEKNLDEINETFTYIKASLEGFATKIDNLSLTIKDINTFSNVINNIAEQTNLLALNAAIESARVGEAGRGFAVVASEIRNLAEQSKESSNNIAKLISHISHDTNEIVGESKNINLKLSDSTLIVNDSLRVFKEIIYAIDGIVPIIEHLKEATDDVNKQKNTIAQRVENSSAVAEEIVASSEEIVASVFEMEGSFKGVLETATSLNSFTNELEEEITIFKI